MGEVGGLLVGLAAVLGVLVSLRKQHRKLDEINDAVNNVGVTPTGEKAPPLWARVDSQSLLLDRIDVKLDNHMGDATRHNIEQRKRDDASIARDDASIVRDDAAIVRDDASIVRDDAHG